MVELLLERLYTSEYGLAHKANMRKLRQLLSSGLLSPTDIFTTTRLVNKHPLETFLFSRELNISLASKPTFTCEMVYYHDDPDPVTPSDLQQLLHAAFEFLNTVEIGSKKQSLVKNKTTEKLYILIEVYSAEDAMTTLSLFAHRQQAILPEFISKRKKRNATIT